MSEGRKEERKRDRPQALEPRLGLRFLFRGGGLAGTERDSEAGRVLLGPSPVPVGWETPGGRMGRAYSLSAKVRPPCLGGPEALWLWAPAQPLTAL